MDLDTLKTAWKSLDERLARIEALQSDANALKRAREAEARAQAGQLASRRALRPLAIGLGVQAIAGVVLATIAVAFWAKRMDAGAQFIVYGVLVQAYAVALIASAGQELSLIRRVRMTGAVLDMQGALAALRRWRETVGWVLGLAGGVIWVPLLLMGFAAAGVDLWTERPELVGAWIASGIVFTALIGAGLRWVYRQPRLAAAMRADPAGQSVRRAELALADLRAFEAEGR
ncbi:hypothetical protein [Silanimonas algicola]